MRGKQIVLVQGASDVAFARDALSAGWSYLPNPVTEADMIGYTKKAHRRGDRKPGPVQRGLGIALHTWGGAGHDSTCDVTIHSDGSVIANIGSQDLGTGTLTVIAIVVAETASACRSSTGPHWPPRPQQPIETALTDQPVFPNVL